MKATMCKLGASVRHLFIGRRRCSGDPNGESGREGLPEFRFAPVPAFLVRPPSLGTPPLLRRPLRRRLTLAPACILLTLGACASPLCYPPERWLVDDDRRPIERPLSREESKVGDFVDKQVFYQVEKIADVASHVAWVGRGLKKEEAHNVNNFDEVIASTWFSHRLGRRPMIAEEVARGPGDPSKRRLYPPLTVVSGKSSGLTPGLVVEDGIGRRMVLKFDPSGHADLGSAADVIGSRLFHAFGYNVPENFILRFKRSDLKLSPKAKTRDALNRKIPMTPKHLEELLSLAETDRGGRFRALASVFLHGEPLGPFSYRSRRVRDSNDRIPHHLRRELRGLRVFNSLLNNSDAREANSLDMFVREKGSEKGFVKHHLIDFSSSLGSASVRPKSAGHMYDYRMNYAKVGAELLSGGLYEPYWEKATDPENLSVGMFESELFNPGSWRPSYPNPAFQAATPLDGYWGAKLVMRLTDEAIRKTVAEGKYSDPAAAPTVARILMERRDKIGRYWFSRVNPIEDFEVRRLPDGIEIAFVDLAVRHGFHDRSETRYRYRLGRSSWLETTPEKLFLSDDLMQRLESREIFRVEIEAKRGKDVSWGPPIILYVQKDGNPFIRGLKRNY